MLALSAMDIEYLQLQSEGILPDISNLKPYRCVVVIEQDVSTEWLQKVSNWLCTTGCMYMMAWGKDCSSWDDSVDDANLEQFNYEIPDDSFVMTTWHENELLKEVFWFAKHFANREDCEFKNTLILHISPLNKATEICLEFKNA